MLCPVSFWLPVVWSRLDMMCNYTLHYITVGQYFGFMPFVPVTSLRRDYFL